MKDYRILLLTVVGSIVFILPHLALAQGGGFVPLTKIPGYTDTTDIGSFFNAAFRLGLIIAATLAVVMITLGGIEYMTTDSISKKSGGREKIQNAIIGLLIALLIWIILETINPNLRNFNFNLKQQNFSGQTPEQTIPNRSQTTNKTEQERRATVFKDTPVTSECAQGDNLMRALCISTSKVK